MAQDYLENEDIVDRMLKGEKHWGALAVVIINIAMFLIVEITGTSEDLDHMVAMGASYAPFVLDGQWWRLFTCMFLHFGIQHLFNNLLMLLFLGDTLERIAGRGRYLIICLGGGLLGSLLSVYHQISTGDYYVSAGASGCAFALMGAMVWILIREKGPIEELTLKRLFVYVMLSLYNGYVSIGVDGYAHLGGLFGGFFLCMLLYRKRTSYDQ